MKLEKSSITPQSHNVAWYLHFGPRLEYVNKIVVYSFTDYCYIEAARELNILQDAVVHKGLSLAVDVIACLQVSFSRKILL